MNKVTLFADYYVEEVGAEVWEAFFGQHQTTVFPDEASIPFDPIFSDAERAKLTTLRENMAGGLQWYCLIFENETPIGWHFGFQKSELEYFMANTGILPDYQNRKIYSAFLTYIIQRAVDAGFQFITSIHHADNNAVLIPKLKAGFIIQSFGFLIQSMILESNYGPMIQLVYPAKDIYRKTFSAGFGAKAISTEMNKLIDDSHA
jgi:Acetyltransferase (GNAT) family